MIFPNKRMLSTIFLGLALGVVLLLIDVVVGLIGNHDTAELDSEIATVHAKAFDVPESAANGKVLALFGVSIDESEQSLADGDLLPDLPSHIVKIVAQATVGGESRTLLEVTAEGKTVKSKVAPGVTINGLLVKHVENKQIVIEKDDKEYVVKLFHQKKLNKNE